MRDTKHPRGLVLAGAPVDRRVVQAKLDLKKQWKPGVKVDSVSVVAAEVACVPDAGHRNRRRARTRDAERVLLVVPARVRAVSASGHSPPQRGARKQVARKRRSVGPETHTPDCGDRSISS